jgi:hypothetical protein
MRFNLFNVIFNGFCVILIILISILAVINHNQISVIIDYSIVGKRDNASFVDQTLQLGFSPSIAEDTGIEKNIKEIKIDPPPDYKVTYNKNVAKFAFTSPLKPDTKYTVQFEFNNQSTNSLKSTFNFTTKKQVFSYIKRDIKTDDKMDKIIISDIDQREIRELASDKNIESHLLEDQFLVYTTKNTQTDANNNSDSNNLKIKNLNTGEMRDFKLENTQVSALNFYKDVTSQSDWKLYFLKKDLTTMEVALSTVNLSNFTDKIDTIAVPEDLSRLFALSISPDNRYLLIGDYLGKSYIKDLIKQEDYRLFGFIGSQGAFSQNGQLLSFSTKSDADFSTKFQIKTLSDMQNTNLRLATDSFEEINNVIPFNNENLAILSQNNRVYYDGSFVYRNQLSLLSKNSQDSDSSNTNKDTFTQDSSYNWDLPVMSPDEKLISVEKYDPNYNGDYRLINISVKPKYGELMIYDIAKKDFIQLREPLIGVNLQWQK